MNDAAQLALRITADLAAAEKALQGFGGKVQSLGKQVSAVGVGFSKWVTGPLLAAGAGLFAMAKTTANAGDEIQKMALRTGFGTEMLSELKHAADLSGTSLATLETGTKRMSSVILDAEMGLAQSQRALAELGLTAEDLKGIAPEEQFMRLSLALAEVEDESKRAALAQDIFGRAGTELLPMFAQGAAGIEAMRQEAHDLGLVFSQEAADQAAFFNDELTRLKGAFTGLSREVGMKVMPVITDHLLPALREHLIPAIKGIVEKVVNLIEWFTNLDPRWQKLIGLAIGLAVAIGPVLAVVGKFITLGGGLVTGIGKIAGAASGLGKVVTSVFTAATSPVGLAVLAIGGLIAVGVLLWKNWDKIKEWASKTWGRIKDIIGGVIGTIKGWIGGFIDKVRDGINWVKNLLGLNREAVATMPVEPPEPRASTGTVEEFAGGGRVPGPLGAPRLAVVHGGETVRTPSQEAGLRGGVRDITLNVYQTVSDRPTADYAANELGRMLRNLGVEPV